MISYDYFGENKTNICLIREDNSSQCTNFYCLIKENEGCVYEEILAGYISDIQKQVIINNLSQRPDIPDFFKNYIKNKILHFI